MAKTTVSAAQEADEGRIAAALAAVEAPQKATGRSTAEATDSITLQALGTTRRPLPETVCERCPHAVWFASPTEVKCYCRVMYLVTWSTKDPTVLTACDGMYLGQE